MHLKTLWTYVALCMIGVMLGCFTSPAIQPSLSNSISPQIAGSKATILPSLGCNNPINPVQSWQLTSYRQFILLKSTGGLIHVNGGSTYPAYDRSYMASAPGSYNPRQPLPMVFVWHGTGAGANGIDPLRTDTMGGTRNDPTPEQRQLQTRSGALVPISPLTSVPNHPEYLYGVDPYPPWGEDQPAIYIYPDGLLRKPSYLQPSDSAQPPVFSTSWDWDARESDYGEDLALFDALYDYFTSNFCVDLNRVFTEGFSAGGYFSTRLACLRGEKIKAANIDSGGLPPDFKLPNQPQCSGIMPIWISSKDTDSTIPFVSEIIPNRDFWLQKNGCISMPDSKPFPYPSTGRFSVSPSPCAEYSQCSSGKHVIICEVSYSGNPNPLTKLSCPAYSANDPTSIPPESCNLGPSDHGPQSMPLDLMVSEFLKSL